VRMTSHLKPMLTEINKWARVEYCISKINRIHSGSMYYSHDYDVVDVDEKWFHLTFDGQTFYLAPDEEPPARKTRHKGYIDKIMFLCATARPRKLADGTWFDGKLGIWLFGKFVPAQRSSKNRPKGTPCWENETVDTDTYRSMLMNNVVPAILDNWPEGDFRNPRCKIFIQQDGVQDFHPAR
jgi:hypothetical protein